MRRDDFLLGSVPVGAMVKKIWAGLLALVTIGLLLYAAATIMHDVVLASGTF